MTHQLAQPATAAEVCDLIGRKAIADRIGVGLTQVSNAAVEGLFPARWYLEMRDLCRSAGVECPERLFNWKGPTHSTSGDAA